MGTVVGGAVALLVGAGLAAATILGIVQSQTSANEQLNGNPAGQVMDYGTNQ